MTPKSLTSHKPIVTKVSALVNTKQHNQRLSRQTGTEEPLERFILKYRGKNSWGSSSRDRQYSRVPPSQAAGRFLVLTPRASKEAAVPGYIAPAFGSTGRLDVNPFCLIDDARHYLVSCNLSQKTRGLGSLRWSITQSQSMKSIVFLASMQPRHPL